MLDPSTALRAAHAPVAPPQTAKSRAAVFGAVGKVGEALLNSVLACSRYERVYVLTRKPLDSTVSRLTPLLIRGEDLTSSEPRFAPETKLTDLYCCLAPSRTFYRRDDVYHRVLPQHVLPLARAGLALGASRMVLVKPADTMSQMGGYGRYLTDVEELELVKLPYHALVILRPHQEPAASLTGNPAQRLAHWILSTLGSYMTPARLRPRRAKTIADACVSALEQRGAGVHIISLDQLQAEDA